MDPKIIVFHILALLPPAIFGYVTWRLIHHRERLAAIAPALVTITAVFFHPLTQLAADSLIARPYALRKKAAADAASLIGKDYATVVAQLGKPNNTRASGPPTISTIATREIKIIPGREPYTALDYHAGSVFYLGTRFIVFLDSKGIVYGYRVKWEKSDADRNFPKRDLVATDEKSDIAAATHAWIEAFASHDAARIAALYAPDAVFWGTNSSTIRDTPALVQAYFENLKDRPTVRIAIDEQHIRVYGDTATNSGRYSVHEVKDGQPTVRPLRFSFTYHWRDGRWLIVNHHSSAMPQ